MCAWNCEGWLQKLDLKEVVCFLRSFDIFSLSQTFVNSKQQHDSFCDYDDLFQNRQSYHCKVGRLCAQTSVIIHKTHKSSLQKCYCS